MIAMLKAVMFRTVDLLVAALAPVIAFQRADSVWRRRYVIAVHAILVLLLFAGLTAVQVIFQLEAFVRSSLPFVRSFWLPMVGFLGYTTVWSAWFVARTLRQPDEKPLFDSVATSLRDGLDRFTRAGIDPGRTPLYLVLGAPAGGIRDFFSSAHIQLAVLPTAEEADEAVQVCGNRDAIYICCRDTSLLGHYARQSASTRMKVAAERCASETRLRGVWGDRESTPVWRGGAAVSATAAPHAPQAHQDIKRPPAVGPMGASIHATATLMETAKLATAGISQAAGDATIERVQQTFGMLESITSDHATPCSADQRTTVLQPRQTRPQELRLDAGDAERLLQRLETLCHEIVSVREPYCPINGVIAMIPLSACDHAEASDHVGMRLERDLRTIVQTTNTHLSVQVIYCDLDLCEGSQPFLDRFPESQRHRRLGAIIPAVPVSESESAASSLDRAVQWICNDLFPPLGYRLMSRDMQDVTNDRDLCMGNHRIQRFVQQMRDRRERMSRMLRRSVAGLGNQIRIRGCFLAATGIAGHASKQAFCEGVVPIILDMQNEIQWTRERLDRDRWERMVAVGTYVVVLAFAIATAALLVGGPH